MLQIFFCDDNPFQLKLYTELAQKCILLQNWDIKITYSALTPEDLLTRLPSRENTGLYFLDIEFTATPSNCQDGFQLANEIRKRDPRCFLVFITSHLERTMEVFQNQLEALDFICKTDDHEVMKQRIFQCIRTAWTRYQLLSQENEHIFKLRQGSVIQFLPCSEIFYIEASEIPHRILLHTVSSVFDTSGHLVDILKEYPNDFLRCNRSTLINARQVKELHLIPRTLLLQDGTALPVSVRCLNELRKHFSNKSSDYL